MRELSRWVPVSAAPALFLVWGAVAHAQGILTEAEAIARATVSSPRLTIARARPAQVAAEERARRALANPVVTVQQEDAAGVRDRFLLVEQSLPLGGRRALLSRAGAHAVEAAEATAMETGQAVRRDTRLAFANAASAIARERVLDEGLESLNRLTGRLRQREDAGEGSAFDRLRAERELADVNDDRRATAAESTYWRVQLSALIGEPDGGGGLRFDDQPARFPLPPADEAIRVALASRPELRAAAAEVERWRVERQASSRLRWPVPSISAGWKETAEGARAGSGYAVSLGVAVPLFARGAAESSAAASAQAASEANRELVARTVEADVRGAHARAEEASARADAYAHDAVARSRDLVRIATLAYEEGELGILELLDAHRVLLGAELRAVELQLEARTARVLLDHAMGIEVVR